MPSDQARPVCCRFCRT